ncbi:MAG: phosphotransferase [Desulfovibrionales bacterium]|nr:phosphotransferase [Desulfovibrionales bacterium]
MTKQQTILRYIHQSEWLEQLTATAVSDITFLAAGEYNENWILTLTPSGSSNASIRKIVFRINHGSQINQGDNQITYEFNILRALQHSGVTPVPFFHDAAAGQFDEAFDKGVLLMEYLEGTPLDYTTDLDHAARIFSATHSQPVPEAHDFIHQQDPIGDILTESRGLLSRFAAHPKTAERKQLEAYAATIEKLSDTYASVFAEEPQCIVNTEVNSGNFIINRPAGTAHLVDWEKAVVSCRYQDLGHFLAPITTLWKTDFVAADEHKKAFLRNYKRHAGLSTPMEELYTLTQLLEKTFILRGLSWCYMAWYEYTQQDRTLKNSDTFQTIERYLDNIEWFLQ